MASDMKITLEQVLVILSSCHFVSQLEILGLVTRALAEMTRIGTAYGANPLTFLTLAGVGDLFLTCGSRASRNFTVGYRLGKGEKLEDILVSLGSVAEGVTTTKGAKAMIDKLKVRAPIVQGIYGVLYEG